jgi:hypothetical protein
MGNVRIAQPPWHQHLHLLAQQFRALVPEQPLCLGIDPHDVAIRIDHDDGVRRRLDEGVIFSGG